MASLNLVIIGGNLTRDPELRFTPKGLAVADFGVAVNRKWKTDSGELKEEVSFIDCSAFGRTAENIVQYFRKGGSIIIEGRLKQETWEDRQDGRKRSKLKVFVSIFHFAGEAAPGGKTERAPEQSRAASRPPAAAPKAAESDNDGGAGDENDVPFSSILKLAWRVLCYKWSREKTLLQVRAQTIYQSILPASSDGGRPLGEVHRLREAGR